MAKDCCGRFPPLDQGEVIEAGLPEPECESASSGEELDRTWGGRWVGGHVVEGWVRVPRISRMYVTSMSHRVAIALRRFRSSVG